MPHIDLHTEGSQMRQHTRDEVAEETAEGCPHRPEGIADDELVVDLYLEGEEHTGDEPDEDIG